MSKLSASVFDNALNIARLSVRKGILPGKVVFFVFFILFLGPSCWVDESHFLYFGVFAGSGVAFLHASKELDKLPTANYAENAGIKLLQNALKVVFSLYSIFLIVFFLISGCA